jgi:hypothetical protein
MVGRDPMMGSLTQPMSRHSYLYGFNNPVNLTDPSGLQMLAEIDTSRAFVSVLVAIRGIGYLVKVNLESGQQNAELFQGLGRDLGETAESFQRTFFPYSQLESEGALLHKLI